MITILPPLNHPEAHYSLVMLDLDRPNIITQTYEEWCHWLVSNINVKDYLHIHPSPSPFLQTPIIDALNPSTPSDLQPQSTTTTPGTVIFNYVPTHPMKSRPNKTHRYFFALLQQPTLIQTADLKTYISSHLAQKYGDKLSSAFESLNHGEGEKRIEVAQRGGLRLYDFMQHFGMQLVGYNFMINEWKIEYVFFLFLWIFLVSSTCFFYCVVLAVAPLTCPLHPVPPRCLLLPLICDLPFHSTQPTRHAHTY